MDSPQQTLYRIRQYIDFMGIPLTKVGEIIGSQGKSRQAKITIATNFLTGKPRAYSLERVDKLCKFFGKDFLSISRPLTAASSKASYGLVGKIEKASEKQLNKMLSDLADHDPDLFQGVALPSLNAAAKRIILRAYFRNQEI